MFSKFKTCCLATICCVSPALTQNAPLADPMRPAIRAPRGATGAATADSMRLQGIVIAESRKLALIGGEFLEEGQQIFGLRIERIERETVTVRRDGKTIVLRPESAAAEAATESGESR